MARIYVTGGLRVIGEPQTDGTTTSFVEADLPGSQGRLVFAALVLERRPVSRDELADMVWADIGEATRDQTWQGQLPKQWNSALSAIVSKIRSLLTKVGVDSGSITTTSSAYSIQFGPETWVDLEDAYRRLDSSEGSARHGDSSAAVTEATVAASILQRPFLVGINTEWVENQRRRQADALFRSLMVLARAWIDQGDIVLAATIAASAVELDPLRETGHRLLMEAEWARGDRGAAMRALARCESILRDQLGVDPSPQTLALAAKIRG